MNKTIFQDLLEEQRATNRYLDAILTKLEEKPATEKTPFPSSDPKPPPRKRAK